jgi:hypothetical protein
MNLYDALFACYRSGQMSEAQMQAHMRDDPSFASYVHEKVNYSADAISVQ